MPRLQHKSVLALAWPLILSNISVPLLGMVDTAILGHLPQAQYLSAVAVGASILSIVFWAMGFLRMGITGLAAQAWGQQNHIQLDALLMRSAVLAVVVGLLLMAIRTPLLGISLTLMQPSAEAAALAQSYGEIRMLGAPAVLLNFVIVGWFIGRQNTRVPMLIVLTTNVINILLDVVFILGLELNSDGAALATLCAEVSGLCIGIICVLRAEPRMLERLRQVSISNWRHYRRLLGVNRHLFIRTACLLFTIAFFTAQGSRQGDSTLAANSIIFQLLMLLSYGLDGIAHSAEALVGKAFGRRDPKLFSEILATTGVWSLVIAVGMSLFFWIAQGWLISLFTDIQNVLEILNIYFVWLYALPLLCVWAFWLDGVYIGAGGSRVMQYSMMFSVFIVFLPSWWLSQSWQNHGLWLAFSLFNLSRGVTLALCLPSLRGRLSREPTSL
ncbi:MATE family efflux transporter [Pseudomaricurvus alkylphenolicus]|uniref:MATE family efflux transporter n=1 Tax=Pseudomaricurvus alkylphenolicus TaxID=1306991 RepID=UPI00141FFE57|nr:MATE family efflux transporter [Pseudomaricurvus alkylphenolicus]NIB39520.1 MATE family efflux transporter [Pseudomaricurvus alkylphenolicus]